MAPLFVADESGNGASTKGAEIVASLHDKEKALSLSRQGRDYLAWA